MQFVPYCLSALSAVLENAFLRVLEFCGFCGAVRIGVLRFITLGIVRYNFDYSFGLLCMKLY